MNWRPIKTAPKDEHILLSYIGGDQKAYAGQGRWIEVPHDNCVTSLLDEGKEPPQMPFEGHWEIGYVAVMQVSGRRWNGHSYVARTYRVNPTHWQPLPKPSKLTKF